jgi:peptidyl-prolyl cis-trans isomerase D
VAVKPDPDADFAAVKPQVAAALEAETAQQAAVKAASDLAYSIYDGKVTRSSLDAFLSGRSVKVESLAPFTSEAGPAELGGSREVAAAAFELNADRFYSEGIPTPSGAVVLIWKDLLPSRQPTLTEVRDKVKADATDNQKRLRFVEFGREMKADLQRRLKAGEAFDKAAAEAAGSVKVAVKTYPPFKLREQPHGVDQSILSVLDTLNKGSVSDMEATADKGVIVYAADKKLPTGGDSNPLFATIKVQLAESFARNDSTSIMREVVDAELKRTDKTLK